MLFAAPVGGRPDAAPAGHRQPLDHPEGYREITALRMVLPRRETLSRAAHAVREAGLVLFDAGEDHLAEIEFDGGGQGRSADFRPALPLVAGASPAPTEKQLRSHHDPRSSDRARWLTSRRQSSWRSQT